MNKLFNQISFFLFYFIVFGSFSFCQNNDELPGCEWCGADEAPPGISWKAAIPDKNEPGEPLIITGTVFNSDKKTPAADAVIYVYHTNSKGIYPKRGDEKGNGRRHGYLRAWMKTNEKGKFQFTTIRPGSYPNSTEPAHIHMTIKPEGKEEYYLTTLTFSDDPLATEKKTRNGDVLTLTKNEKGTWIGEYSAVLRD